jgi:uncharacterized protein (DUF3084 family)
LSINLDHNKFVNLLIEKTNQKLNQFQNQIILLETQLQLAVDLNNTVQKENEALNSEIEKLKKKKEKSLVNTSNDSSLPN